MSLNSKALRETAYAALGLPVVWAAKSTSGVWPETGVTLTFNDEVEDVVFSPTSFSSDSMIAIWSLTAEQVELLEGLTSWRIQINDGWPLITGYLSWGSGWDGSPEVQSLGTVIVGPPGLSAYDLAVAEGFVGDEAAWLASLVGADGDPGVGVPIGGATGQVLAKASGDDYDAAWIDPPAGGSATEVRSAVDSTGSTVHYIGVAPVGTAEGDPGWTITRITVAPSGDATTTTAAGPWTTREGAFE